MHRKKVTHQTHVYTRVVPFLKKIKMMVTNKKNGKLLMYVFIRDDNQKSASCLCMYIYICKMKHRYRYTQGSSYLKTIFDRPSQCFTVFGKGKGRADRGGKKNRILPLIFPFYFCNLPQSVENREHCTILEGHVNLWNSLPVDRFWAVSPSHLFRKKRRKINGLFDKAISSYRAPKHQLLIIYLISHVDILDSFTC